MLEACPAHHLDAVGAVRRLGIGTREDPVRLIDFAGMELLTIDENTTIPGFVKELRWNQAWHRLAQGM